jgi:hypothetical protein
LRFARIGFFNYSGLLETIQTDSDDFRRSIYIVY